ncbi:hypothetical protein GXP67_09560 [Rhodocytophaga rosea]|uniref:LTD domain-containing protein n=1 Tax=Rhodocytophaga rosea TaxID=2704465 RepID=A0A6C0GG82_9BACT|nr:lamin tail domain-containing protein [Rhodocytophaga rosea]QHT66885.1 hypothetical protein GXP67_09560 [Rhodocytophaga rosea]
MKTGYLLTIFCLFSSLFSFGQLQDDFTDGSFSDNPAWNGDLGSWTVISGQLRSNSSVASSSFYLSTPSELVAGTQWEFYVKLSFNTSGTNYLDVYLTSESENLKTTPNGYFVRIGGAKDEISLYKKVAGVSTLLINGTDGITNTSSNSLKIKVTCNASYEWKLERDASGTGASYTSEGTLTDASLPSSHYFGIVVQQSTSSFFNKHFFDNFQIIPIDVTPPTLKAVQVLSANTLELTFSETLTQSSAENVTNYTISPAIGNPATAKLTNGINPTDATKVVLTFATDLVSKQPYEISVISVEDASQNAIIVPEKGTFTYVAPFVPQFRDIVMNEIFADPSPPVDLPEAEFVELYNTTDQTINLSGYIFTDGSSTATFGNITLASYSYLIICNTNNAALFTPITTTIGLSNFPSLNNSGETLTLKNPSGKVIDKVTYALSWYQDAVKDDGGWTLEQINPKTACNNAQNWTASADETGGTPGKQNSVFNQAPDLLSPALLSTQLNGNTVLELHFSETMDSVLLKDIQHYTVNKGLSVISARALSPDYSTVQLTLHQTPELGEVYTISVNGLSDCPGNIINPSTMTFGIGAIPQPYELLITEILADESPKIGLPEAEFIELYNPTNKLLSLENLTFSDGNGAVKLSAGIIAPHEYIILCASVAVAQYKSYGQAISVSGFSLNNSGEPLKLMNAQGVIIHAVSYSSDWYTDSQKSGGGWSLEMINPSATCPDKSNWTASTDESGGTPGKQNSVYSLKPDIAAPVLQSVQINGDAELQLNFSKTMDSVLLKNTQFYSIDQGLTVTAANVIAPDYSTVQLSLSQMVEPGKVYWLTINGLQDCPGNKLVRVTMPFGIGAVPQPYELLITEILADETPKVGLPEAEFIELYNPTRKLLSLDKLTFSDGNGAVKLNGGVIAAEEYIILCASSAVPVYQSYGRTLSVSGFSLNNSGELLKLTNAQGALVHMVNYTSDWYRDPVKANGGWSLEMIDIHNPCGDEGNWAASESINGGTPGKANSVQASKPDLTAPKLLQVIVKDSLHINLFFDEKLDSASAALPGIYTLQDISIQSATPVSPFLREVQLQLATPLVKKVMYTLSVKNSMDCNGNISSTLLSDAFTMPEQGDSMDIIINEVLFNPHTGGADFVEIFNRSSKYINLRNWQLADWEEDSVSNARPVAEIDFIMPPHSYLILTSNKASIRENYPKAVEENFLMMETLPTYTDEAGSVILLNNLGKITDRVDYAEDMHFSLIDDVEGISLERINPDGASNTSSNWHSAASAEGYATPGYQNSQFLATTQPVFAFNIFPKVFTPDEDGRDDFTTFNYKFDLHGNVATISIFDVQGREVKKIARNQLLATEGFYSWDGTNEQGAKVRTGAYIIHFILFDISGKKQFFKERVIVGAKF